MDLLNALNNKDEILAMSLITPENAKQIYENNHTPLILACENNMTEVALALIATGNSNPEQVTNNDITALMWACRNKMQEVALALIATGNSKPEQVTNHDITALMIACDNNMTEVALALIKTGNSKPEQVNINNVTALMWACVNNMTEVALALIETGNSNSEHVNNAGNTALILACDNNMTEVALALIKTGNSKPEQVTNTGITALIWACNNNMTEVALALIATGNSKPEQVTNTGITALLIACDNNMTEVALALIATGQSNSNYIDSNGNTALHYAIENNLTTVINKLSYKINTTRSSYNYIQGENISNIGLYNGITFEIEGVLASLLKSELNQILNTRSMIYDTNQKYVYTQSFSPIQNGLVLWNELNEILSKFSSNYYILIPNKNIGKYKFYKINIQKPECIFNSIETVNNDDNEPTKEQPSQIIIKYQNKNYSIDVPEDTVYTYRNILNILKQTEPIFASIDNSKQLIRFMFSGRIYQNKGLDEKAIPGIHQLIITQRGTRGGKKKRKSTRKIKR
jgi:ankyrin repeat protein